MCLNNWGGIDHKVLEFHEYVNLFSGKSGSGKSTVMDAIQVILYGSFSPSFLNKAADDAKNRRSVLSYLRGEQKDGSANRKDCDFCSVIALEIEDTGTHITTCIGIAFEVRKSDSEIKKFVYFSHSGKMPESEYLTEQGVCYSNQEIKKLVSARTKSDDNRGKGEVNRIYGSKEAYLGTLYDVILGYIDQNRFITMEKSAIALKMTNGTGQFIRDYMFPKNTSNTIATISEQLDSYRQIKEKIEDLRKRIELLSEIQASGKELVRLQTDIVRAEAMIRCIGIEDLRARIQAAEDDKRNLAEKQEQCKKKVQELSASREEAQQKLIQVSADLKASDLGGKQQQYEELDERSRMLADNTRQWQKILQGMKNWEEDDVITDYISNPVLNMIAELNQGRVTEELCQNLHLKIESAKQNIEDEVEDYRDQRREIGKQLKEKKRLVDDMKHDRKPYDENLRSARSALSQQLSDRYGQTVKVQIFADLFDVQEEEWKNAIEGRMGRLKHSLITEPQYAHEAAVLFRNMKQYENVDLINSKAIADSKPDCMEGSLYEAVKTQEAYVDVCLRRYLGHIIKCRSVEELEQVRDGVTPDCYSYSNFIFRHLKKKDYTTRACIGRRVSKARLAEYEKDVEIPVQMEGKRLILFMERTKPSTLWIDGDSVGTLGHIYAPHCYSLPALAPGSHHIKIRIDNSPSSVPAEIQSSHAWTDGTQTNWNGILGDFYIEAAPHTYLKQVQVYPSVKEKKAHIHVNIYSDSEQSGVVTLSAKTWNTQQEHQLPDMEKQVGLSKGENKIELTLDMGNRMQTWSEFHPTLYALNVTLATNEGKDNIITDFGMRDFATEGTQFTINGFKTFLRGKHDACVFPLTGYAPMDVKSWRKVFQTAKSLSLIHI